MGRCGLELRPLGRGCGRGRCLRRAGRPVAERTAVVGQVQAGFRPGRSRRVLLRCLPGGRLQAGWQCRLSQRAWLMSLMVIISATARASCASRWTGCRSVLRRTP